ncbi:MAG: redoxin domain-containing protein [Chloroflexi bacterium]|nr:redoxin domain-containing protein [Chloroflexota bacterium]
MQTREFVKLQDQFELTDTLIVGISTDSVERLQIFGETHSVKFPLISDSGGSIARLYDVRRWFGLGTSRVTYLIDKDGLIRDVHHDEVFAAGHAHRALTRLQDSPDSD